jgi:DUF1680 family protein
MAKRFFTEWDIEEMVARGEMTLQMGDEVVLTELAYEKAGRLGMRLVQAHQLPPAAPVRPYLAQGTSSSCQACREAQPADDSTLRQRIRDAVAARLGNQVDPALLETIITRVLNNVGMK